MKCNIDKELKKKKMSVCTSANVNIIIWSHNTTCMGRVNSASKLLSLLFINKLSSSKNPALKIILEESRRFLGNEFALVLINP